MNQNTLFDLKSDAHGLIDDLEKLGLPKSAIYQRVAFRLHIPIQEAHLGSTCTITQTEKIVRCLVGLKKSRIRKINEGLPLHKRIGKSPEQIGKDRLAEEQREIKRRRREMHERNAEIKREMNRQTQIAGGIRVRRGDIVLKRDLMLEALKRLQDEKTKVNTL